MSETRRSIREDWTVIPFLITTSTGFAVAILDFVFLQGLRLQPLAVVGLPFLLVGGFFRVKARLELRTKAGFGTLAGTGVLQIVKGHRLVRDGLYKHVRHPIYLGETLRNLGIVLILTSIYGVLLVAVASAFLLLRIGIEEKMLLEVFGQEYREYQRNTKRMIPYVY